MIVVDTNIIVHFILNGTEKNIVTEVHKKTPIWLAPRLWQTEFLSVLSVYLRKDILQFEDILNAQFKAKQMMSSFSLEVEPIEVLELINTSSCSSYDCEFVALAKDLEVPLLTFDKKILAEFPETAIHPKDFVTEE
ncbi:MAG: type II toxin-antitoxin system VapC family toxin [Balneolaceae bacterium]|nr:type II toxin-antitoxin system VapC family toxin [Balneolaceae bacterium]